MDILSIIANKRDKKVLSKEEINFFIDGYIKQKTITDYQASALLMAIYLNGMNDNEAFYLTEAMLYSGKTIDISKVNGIKIDKHSTGGVGDKLSLILCPILATFGIKIAKMSGRGLGFTGGTVDKLESIGFKFDLKPQQYLKILKDEGIFIISQTEDIVPADKQIYALRNSSSCVESLPLVAASVASKKLAINTDYIFFDVKFGDGAFCKNLQDAKKLARLLVNICKKHQRKSVAHLTSMLQPLGRSIGNAIEVKESIDFLSNNCTSQELSDLVYDLVADILVTTKKYGSIVQAKQAIKKVLENKFALNKFKSWVCAQGANKNVLSNNIFFNPKYKSLVKANKSGYVSYISTKEVGMISFNLGAGRLKKNDPIDYQAGIWLNKTYNEYVDKDEVLATLYSSKPISQSLVNQFLKNTKISNHKLANIRILGGIVK